MTISTEPRQAPDRTHPLHRMAPIMIDDSEASVYLHDNVLDLQGSHLKKCFVRNENAKVIKKSVGGREKGPAATNRIINNHLFGPSAYCQVRDDHAAGWRIG